MQLQPLLACGPSGPALLIIFAILGGGGLLLGGSLIAGIVCLCGQHKTLGMWLVFIPAMIAAALVGWLRVH